MATQNHFTEIATNLVQFLQTGFLCDTVLVTKSKELRAHSLLLAAVSPVFRAAFEVNSLPGLQYIELSTFDAETVEIALNFIYTGKLLLSPRYVHIENLHKLFGRLKHLGLEAQRLNGCEIRFLNNDKAVKENRATNTLPSSVDRKLRTPKRALPSPSSKKVNSRCKSQVARGTGKRIRTGVEFQSSSFRQEDEKGTNADQNVNCLNVADGSNIHEDITATSNIQEMVKNNYLSKIDVKYEEGREIEMQLNKLDSAGIQVACSEADQVSEFTNDDGLTSIGFQLEENCDTTFSEKVRNSPSYDSLETADTVMVGSDDFQNNTTKSKSFCETDNGDQCLDSEIVKIEIDAAIDAADSVMEFCPDFGLETLVKVEEASNDNKVDQSCFTILPVEDGKHVDSSDPSSAKTQKKFPCDVCGKLLTKKAMKGHSFIHTGERPFKCTVCGKSFTMSANLIRHGRLHTGIKPHLCHLCGKSFIQKVTLQDHLTMHVLEKKFKCSTCGETFLKSKQLTQHNHDVHRTGDKPADDRGTSSSPAAGGRNPVLCDFCGKSFVSKVSLKHHAFLHLPEKPFKCCHCDKRFITKQNLGQHMLNHTGEKPFVCKICGIAYKRKQLLLWHEHIHTGDKPYVCNLCGKSFAYSCSLRVHTRTHTGERPYKCKICGTAYSQSTHLQVHMRTHTGEKPFACERCDKAYKNRLDLRLHCNRVHGINITKSRSASTNNSWQ